MLAPHKVDTSGYEKKYRRSSPPKSRNNRDRNKMTNLKTGRNGTEKRTESGNPQQAQSNRGYQPIDESKINWKELEEKWGVKRDDLEKSRATLTGCSTTASPTW